MTVINPPPVASGGLQYFTENEFTASPNNVINASQFIVLAGSTNADFIASSKGTGALQRQVANNLTSGGNKRGLDAVDFQVNRGSASQVASGDQSFIGQGSNNTATGLRSLIVNGINNVATGQNSTVLNGNSNDVSGFNASALNGNNNLLTGANSLGIGSYSDDNGVAGKIVFASGKEGATADVQTGWQHFRRSTSSNTPVALTSTGSSPNTTNIIILKDDQLTSFSGKLNVRSNTNINKVWDIEGAITRGVGVASVAVLYSTFTVKYQDAGAAAWAANLVADTVNGGAYIEVIGQIGVFTRWSATIKNNELIY